jgi:hypothetical protein
MQKQSLDPKQKQKLNNLKTSVNVWRKRRRYCQEPFPLTLLRRASKLAEELGYNRVGRELNLRSSTWARIDQAKSQGRGRSRKMKSVNLMELPVPSRIPNQAPEVEVEFRNGNRIKFNRIIDEQIKELVSLLGSDR